MIDIIIIIIIIIIFFFCVVISKIKRITIIITIIAITHESYENKTQSPRGRTEGRH